MNRLPPTLRPEYRYMKFRIHSERDVELGEVVEAVWESALDYLGTKGVAEADFWLIGNKFNVEEGQGVIRVRNEMENDLRASLTMVSGFNGKEGFIEVVKVSGVLGKL